MARQRQLNLDGDGAKDGYAQWVAVRRLAGEEAVRRLNLPVDRDVEIWLTNGIRLRGKLRLGREILFVEEDQIKKLPLEVDHVKFTFAEIESCTALE